MLVDNKPRVAVTVVCAIAIAAMAGCGEKPQQQAPQVRATPVDVVQMQLSDAVIQTELTGRTSAYQVADVRPQVSGIILKRLFAEGSTVKRGESLYQIDPALYEATVRSARATVAQAQAALELKTANAKRSAELIKTKAVSRQANDTAQMEYKAAVADLSAAQAALATAEINLRYTQVKSPITGQVSLSEVTPGALVTANQSAVLTTVQTLDPIYVDVPQSFENMDKLRAEIRSGAIQTSAKGEAEVSLVLADGSTYEHKGKLTFTDMMVDEKTGTVRLRALFPNPRHDLLPGLYVRAKLVDGVRQQVIKLDQRATMRMPTGKAYVYVVNKDNKVETRFIETLGTEGSNWIVGSGLNVGDTVIVSGIQKVRPGAPVVASVESSASQPAK